LEVARDYRFRTRRRLRELIQENDTFDVVEAALLIAADEYPDLDIAREKRRLESVSMEAERRLTRIQNPFARLDGLRAYMFEELGFRGNTESYDDPRNSYINEVLNRRIGIPLSLSVVFVEVARAAGFEACGIALPGHFIAQVGLGGRRILVDPFHGGHVITEDDCRNLVARSTGKASLFRPSILVPAMPRAIVVRMLINLKRIHLNREDYTRALGAVERILIATPDDAREIRDRGFLLAHLGNSSAAVADLENYLSVAPSAPDAEAVRGRLAWILRRMSEAN